ncbi:MAG: DegQ family serine endoprotease [Acidobacteriota bacterium]|nr:DegQ family serine endoprotease [Acidobacteriota bacterium]
MTRSQMRAGAVALALGAASLGAWIGVPASPVAQAAITAPVAADAGQGRVVTQGFADVVAKVTPAVVTIRTERSASPRMTQLPQLPEGFGDLFGQRAPRGGRPMPPPLQRGLGSGVIVSTDGYILTNNHVVEGSARIQVELSDRRVLDAKLIGADEPSDLAVIKIDAADLPVVPIGDSTAMRVGDLVLAVGNPLGVGQTVTMGIVSAKGRATGFGDGSYEDFLQTDAPINQGNSGGALVNTAGELVGINSQILSPSGGSIGIGFAVPSNMAKHVMDQLVSNGRVRRGRLGVTVQGVTSDLAAGLGLDKTEGALVSDVTPGGAAARAGLKRGDVILGYQGRPVVDTNAFRNEIAATTPGSTVTLQVLREGKSNEVKATLEEMAAGTAANRSEGAGPSGAGKFGLTIEPLTPQIANRLELPRDVEGVAITAIDPSGAAASAGLREGDVIQQINGRSVRSTEQVRAGLDAASDKPVVLLVARGSSSFFVPLRAPRG